MIGSVNADVDIKMQQIFTLTNAKQKQQGNLFQFWKLSQQGLQSKAKLAQTYTTLKICIKAP